MIVHRMSCTSIRVMSATRRIGKVSIPSSTPTVGSGRRTFASDNNSADSLKTVDVDDDQTYFDVVIVGGGVVGAALARNLSSLTESNLKIGLVEAGAGHSTEVNDTPAIPHPRSYALSPSSLRTLGIGFDLAEELGGCYESMQVWEAGHPASLLWSTKDLSDEASPPPLLGCCVEHSVLQRHLWHHLGESTNTRLFSNTELENVQFPNANEAAGWVTGTTSKDQKTIRTQLLVAADGANSQIRKAAGIGVNRTEYGQTAMTCTVQLKTPLKSRRAFQRFVDGQPLALLPTRSPNHAVIVWSTSPAQARTEDPVPLWNDLLQTGPQPPPRLFGSDAIQSIVDTVQYGGALLGATDGFSLPPVIESVVSPVFTFPLAMQFASLNSTAPPGLALVGDAACTVHPMAGQGLNLGLQGVIRLTAAVERASRAGLPVTTFLKPTTLPPPEASGIHVLQRLFQTQGALWQNLKCAGMNAVQTVGPARRALARAACYGA